MTTDTQSRERAELMKLEESRKTLIAYLHVKAQEHDWHGVSDAANDIRVMEAQMSVLKTKI